MPAKIFKSQSQTLIKIKWFCAYQSINQNDVFTLRMFPVGILYNFSDTGGTNVANFYQ